MKKSNSLEDALEKRTVSPSTVDMSDDDDKELVALGYKPSFKREFSNLATVRSFVVRFQCLWCLLSQISFAFSIMVSVPGEMMGQCMFREE